MGNYDNIVNGLRGYTYFDYIHDAADAIEAQAAEIERLNAFLEKKHDQSIRSELYLENLRTLCFNRGRRLLVVEGTLDLVRDLMVCMRTPDSETMDLILSNLDKALAGKVRDD